MKAVVLSATWAPKPDFRLGSKDIEGKLTYLGSKVWKDPKLSIEDVPEPEISDEEVLVEIRACGICGSDVHMAQPDKDGYIYYPGLTAFPVVLGHELSGLVKGLGAEEDHLLVAAAEVDRTLPLGPRLAAGLLSQPGRIVPEQ